MDILFTTLLKRPYVFLFLAAFLFLAIRHLGLAKTIIWLIVGYGVAFLSEYSSIHNGFPYGEYHYIYENLQGELLLAGVPVWDSVSYSFMTYASFAAAEYALPKAKLWKLWMAGAALTTILDIITDPVAKLGKDWFLGEIYYYAHDGWYFHVPLSNFAGWFLVAAVIIGVNLLIFRIMGSPHNRGAGKLNLLFYISICLFNTVIAFSIGAYLLGTANLLITSTITIVIVLTRKRLNP
jgi:putative membrane protein